MSFDLRQRIILAGLCISALFLLLTAPSLADTPLSRADALWNFKTASDSSSNGSDLIPAASTTLGIPLSGKEKADSLRQSGDGFIAKNSGDPIYAVKAKDALVVSGDKITLLIRAKDPTGNWGGELIKRREPTMSYNVYTYDFGQGHNALTLGFEIGTAGHPFNTCRFLMSRLPSEKDWLTIVARYDGKTMQLIVNGVVMASALATAPIDTAPDDQFMIGNKFTGELDTVALWKSALDDHDVSILSGTSSVTESPYLNTRTNKGPYYTLYQKMIDQYMSTPAPYTERFRPQFHWTPVSGWMNDPNGLVYYKGLWRQFAQHNLDNENGKRWAYATSPDLVHWTQHPEAIIADTLGDIWSGSAVVDQHDTSGFFHGKAGIVCIYTYFNGNENGRQCQAIAYSADGVTFTKYAGNPVIPELRYVNGQEDDADFRDPKVFWYAPTKRWIMVTGGGFLRIWSSTNLKTWTNEAVEKNIVTECPDLFPLHLDGNMSSAPVWVLSRAGAAYLLGSFDGHQFTPTGDNHRFNFGPDFYAAQTYSNVPDGRRIMSAWMWGWGDDDPAGIATTGGMMTIPVVLSLVSTPDGPRVASNPVKEVDVLRRSMFSAEDVTVPSQSAIYNSPSGNQCEIDATINIGTASKAGLSVLGDGDGHQTLVGYDAVKHEVYVDRAHSGLTGVNKAGDYYSAPLALTGGALSLRIFIDHATVEVFAENGLIPITIRCFPPDNGTQICGYSEGGTSKVTKIVVYPMASIWKK